MGLADGHHLLIEVQEVLLLLGVLPLQPGDLVVLAVGIVVALLSPPELISSGEHRHAGGQRERGEQIAHLTLTNPIDLWVVRRSLDAVVA